MSFAWPGMFLLLLAVPALVVAYVVVTKSRARHLAEMGTMGAMRTRSGRPLRWRRHVAPVLYLLAFVVLVFALARPQTTLRLPKREGTIVLAFDISASMKA